MLAQTTAASLLGRFWEWLKSRPAAYKERLGSIIKLSPEVLEVVDFIFMALFIYYLNSSWFSGPYTIALHHAVSNWLLILVTGLVATFTVFGFLERNFALRRTGAFGAFIVFFSVGLASVQHFPHWLIGFLLFGISLIPLLCFLLLLVFQVQEEKRSDIAAAPKENKSAWEPVAIPSRH